jgi:hypothetical protein
MAPMKNFTPRIVAALALACGALALTGCQSSAPQLDRALDVTALPTSASLPATTPAPTAGLDVHFGPATFGITCATDSAGDGSHGTAALMCSWKSGDR